MNASIASMTAFSRDEHQVPWGTLVWEIRSINHRYLELSFRLPETLRQWESLLREQARQMLHRGKIECQLRVQPTDLNAQQLAINTQQLITLQQVLRQLRSYVPEALPPQLMDLLKWPGVIQSIEVDPATQQEQMSASFQQSLNALMTTRQREGAKLKDFLMERVQATQAELEKIKPLLPQIMIQQREQLMRHVREAQIQVDAHRLEQELVIIAQRIDISEEVNRLEVHLAEVKRLLQVGGVIGRRLDFLMQELHREANTLGAKSVHLGTSHISVELKVLIEQMREQVQNIE